MIMESMTRFDVLDKGFVELVDKMGDDLTVVNAARVSVGKTSEKLTDRDITLIKYMLENGHTSPFEHVVFTFRIKCPLFVRSQWMRYE